MFQNGQKVVVVSSGDPARVIKVQAASSLDTGRYPTVDTTGVTGRDQQVQIVSGGDETRFPKLQGLADARSTADSVITALSPAAWYRNATDVVSSGGFASIWADYASSDKGLVLPGVAGNSATTPDAAHLDLTGDLDIICRCALPDWTPAAIVSLVDKAPGGANAGGYSLIISTGVPGELALTWTDDGGTNRIASSTAATGHTDGSAYWVRATLDLDNGGAYEVKFYTSPDGVTPTWTQLGSTVSPGGTTTVKTNASALCIGASPGPVSEIAGIIYRAIVKSGIDGTTVFDADFSSQAIGAASFTESSSNAATVTINTSGARPAHIGKARDLLQGTGTNQPAYAAGVFTFDGADNFLDTSAIAAIDAQPVTAYLVGKQIAWTDTDFLCDGFDAAHRAALYQNGATPRVSLFAGSIAANNTGATIGSNVIFAAVFNGASSSLRVNNNAKATGNAGAGAPGGITLGAAYSGGFGNCSFMEVVYFAAAHSDAEQDSVITALNNALTVF